MAETTPLSVHHPEQLPAGGVIVVQEAFGVGDHIEDACQRFAHAGWLAVAPRLFHRTGDPILP
jgi:carboxymethylenebutenolidase